MLLVWERICTPTCTIDKFKPFVYVNIPVSWKTHLGICFFFKPCCCELLMAGQPTPSPTYPETNGLKPPFIIRPLFQGGGGTLGQLGLTSHKHLPKQHEKCAFHKGFWLGQQVASVLRVPGSSALLAISRKHQKWHTTTYTGWHCWKLTNGIGNEKWWFFFNRKYRFSNGGPSIVMLVFGGKKHQCPDAPCIGNLLPAAANFPKKHVAFFAPNWLVNNPYLRRIWVRWSYPSFSQKIMVHRKIGAWKNDSSVQGSH